MPQGNKIDPFVYGIPIFRENIKKEVFVSAEAERGIGKSTYYKSFCLINGVDENEVEATVDKE